MVGSLDECLHVFREARTAVATAREEELATNARIAANALPHHVHVGSDELAEVGDVVHKRNARGEHRIGGVFGHLGTGHVHENHAEIVHHKGFVEARKQLFSALALHAHHHAVGTHKVLDGVAFLEKFGVARHVEFHLATALVEFALNRVVNFLRRTHRHGTLRYDNHVFIKVLANRLGHLQHIFQIGGTVFVGRCANGRKHDFLVVENIGQRGREFQSAGIDIFQDKFVESRLVNGNFALFQPFDFSCIHIDAGHVSTRISKTRARHQSDIARSNNCNIHNCIFLSFLLYIHSKLLEKLFKIFGLGERRCLAVFLAENQFFR